jgi:hypothetical protein
MAKSKFQVVTCPICKTKQKLLFEQTATGQPTGRRFIAYHPIKVARNIFVDCPLSGKVIDE